MRDFTQMLDQLDAERDLVIGYFAGFSRFEFALINGGFAGGNAHHAVADWPAFLAQIEPHFNYQQTDELQNAVDFLEAHPPKRRALVNGTLRWVVNTDAEQKSRLQAIAVHIKAIRNNLFHGGKYPGTPAVPTERDGNLLRSAIVILEALLTQSEAHTPRVRSMFDSTMPPPLAKP